MYQKVFGGENIRNEILRLLKASKISFQHIIHHETISQNIAKEIGVQMHDTIKSLVARGKKSSQNYLLCLCGDQKANMRALSMIVNESCELEKVDVLKERFGLDVGGIGPFGVFLGITEVYFDSNIRNCNEVTFGCGVPSESIKMKVQDLIALVHPKFFDLAKI